MDTIHCEIKILQEKEVITISGLKESELEIDYSGNKDIEFTPLVQTLTGLIDTEKKIDVNYPDTDDLDEKLRLIVETIIEITEKYNSSLDIEEIEEEEEVKNNDGEENLPF